MQTESTVLSPGFFQRGVLEVAEDLLGRVLVHRVRGQRIAGRIVETEAYGALRRRQVDQACHAIHGMTPRNQSMFLSGGHSYVYLIYGIYHCLNLVCGEEGRGEAVLIRAIEPLDGERFMARRRQGRKRREWSSGPGRLCLAMDIDLRHDALLLHPDSGLWLESGQATPRRSRERSPRIGVESAEASADWPWRFVEKGNEFLSR